MTQARSPSRKSIIYRDAGFSLVEMLVALALLALIAVVIISAIQSASQSIRRLDQDGPQQALLAARQFFTQLFASARPVQWPLTVEGQERQLLGAADSVAFVSDHAPTGQYQGVYETRIWLHQAQDKASGGNLVIEQRLYRRAADSGKLEFVQADPQILIANIASMKFQYLESNATEAAVWKDHWAQANSLPRMIRIDIQFPKTDPRTWEPLYLELMLAD